MLSDRLCCADPCPCLSSDLLTHPPSPQAIEAFQKDPPTTVFLLSMRSGAVGINLTAASHVFIMVRHGGTGSGGRGVTPEPCCGAVRDGEHTQNFPSRMPYIPPRSQELCLYPALVEAAIGRIPDLMRCISTTSLQTFGAPQFYIHSLLAQDLCLIIPSRCAYLFPCAGAVPDPSLPHALHTSLPLQEPCLNPALEEQAIGRSWRMGQKRNVVVKRFYIKVRTVTHDCRAGATQRKPLTLTLSLALFLSR